MEYIPQIIVMLVVLYVGAGLLDRLSPSYYKFIGHFLPFIGYKTMHGESGHYYIKGWGCGWLGHIWFFRPTLYIDVEATLKEMADEKTQGSDEGTGSNTPD